MKHKYVNFEGYGFVIWPMSDTVIHSDIARMVGKHPVSAGFVNFGREGAKCYGESVSLRLMSRKTDTDDLNDQLALSLLID